MLVGAAIPIALLVAVARVDAIGGAMPAAFEEQIAKIESILPMGDASEGEPDPTAGLAQEDEEARGVAPLVSVIKDTVTPDAAQPIEISSLAQMVSTIDHNPFAWDEQYVGKRVKLALANEGLRLDIDSHNGSGRAEYGEYERYGRRLLLWCDFKRGYWERDNFWVSRHLTTMNDEDRVTLTGVVKPRTGLPPYGVLQLRDCTVEDPESLPGYAPELQPYES